MAKKVTPMSELRQKYGRPETEYLDTGIFLINDLMGGGLPTGKYVEWHGLEGTGKTTMVLQVLRNIIEKYKIKAAYMDVEGALDNSLKEGVGIKPYELDDVDEPSFLHLWPGTYPEISQVLARMLSSNYDIIVWDSVASSSVEIKAEDDDEQVISNKLGQDAYQQTMVLKAFKNKFARHGKTLIVIQQMRSNIQLNSFKKGPDHKPAGGKAYDHSLDIRIALSKGRWLEDENKERVGAELRVVTIKNKLTMPYRYVQMDLYFGKGVNRVTALMETLLARGVVARGGAYYYLADKPKDKMQGREGLKEFVRNNYDDLVRKLGNSAKRVDRDAEELPGDEEE